MKTTPMWSGFAQFQRHGKTSGNRDNPALDAVAEKAPRAKMLAASAAAAHAAWFTHDFPQETR